jgi:hypothetical protein
MDDQRTNREGGGATMRLTKVEMLFLCTNLIALGGLLVLMALRGPSVPAVLLAIGACGAAVAKIGKAMSSAPEKL